VKRIHGHSTTTVICHLILLLFEQPIAKYEEMVLLP
jgi:hypothetical protein